MTIQTRPNIILIIIDALRADHLGCYGYHHNTSPNIDVLAKQNVLFEDAYSCINTTDPSLSSIYSGMHPVSHGILNHGERTQNSEIQFYKSNVRPIAQILKQNGYTTMALDFLYRWHKIGFDYYSGEEKSKILNYISPITTMIPGILFPAVRKFKSLINFEDKNISARLTKHALKLIKENKDNNFFLFLHYWDVHSPYRSLSVKAKAFLENNPDCVENEEIINSIGNPDMRHYFRYVLRNSRTSNDIIARYDGAIASVDEDIKKITDYLKSINIFDNTLFIITADHGESLTEHQIYFDHHGLYETTTHVPLIFSYPNGFKESKRISGFVQHIDIIPTILSMLDIDAPHSLDGSNLLPLISGEIEQLRTEDYYEEAHTQRKRAIRTKDYKYIYSLDGNKPCRYCNRVHGETEELYDLNKDPEEITNIAKNEPELTTHFNNKISDWENNLYINKQIKNRVMKIKKLGKISTA